MTPAYAYTACKPILNAPAAPSVLRTSAFTPRTPLRRPRAVAARLSARNTKTCKFTSTKCALGGNLPTPRANDDEANNGHEEDESGLEKMEVELFRQDAQVDTTATAPGRKLVEMPLFPLQVVLNPGCGIPLYIFEMRYRLMFNKINDGQESRFGVVMYDKETDCLARVGCSAELVRFEPLPDGRIMTRNVGRERFRIVRILDEKPYMRALVEYISDVQPEPECATLERDVWTLLQDVLSLSNKLYDKTFDMSAEIRRSAPGDDDASTSATASNDTSKENQARMQEFSFAVNQILDMPLRDQQILLQITDTARRLKRQNAMLRTARNYLAAQVTIKNAGLKGW